MMHTPGPWRDRIATGTPDHMISGGGEGVCVIPFKYGEGSGTARRNANARLIAAAPELLALVTRVASELRYLKGCDGPAYVSAFSGGGDNCGHARCIMVREARALLAWITTP